MKGRNKVAARWDNSEWESGPPIQFWGTHPIIAVYIHSKIAPNSGGMMDWLQENYVKNGLLERGLSLGCGMGAGDRQAIFSKVCRRLDGIDISSRSVEVARQRAQAEGYGKQMTYWVDDLNEIELPENKYDIVFAFGSLHHVEKLEHVCKQIQHTLKPNGLLFMNEYVGPDYFQWTDKQLDIINRVLSILPASWKQTERMTAVPLHQHIALDPSEAVRSSEIIPLFSKRFELLSRSDFGGGLLHPLWGSGLIPPIFFEDNEVTKQIIVKLLIVLDELLVEHKIIDSDFSQLLFRNAPPSDAEPIVRGISADSSDKSRWIDYWLPGTRLHRPQSSKLQKMRRAFQQGGVRGVVKAFSHYLQWKFQTKTPTL